MEFWLVNILIMFFVLEIIFFSLVIMFKADNFEDFITYKFVSIMASSMYFFCTLSVADGVNPEKVHLLHFKFILGGFVIMGSLVFFMWGNIKAAKFIMNIR